MRNEYSRSRSGRKLKRKLESPSCRPGEASDGSTPTRTWSDAEIPRAAARASRLIKIRGARDQARLCFCRVLLEAPPSGCQTPKSTFGLDPPGCQRRRSRVILLRRFCVIRSVGQDLVARRIKRPLRAHAVRCRGRSTGSADSGIVITGTDFVLAAPFPHSALSSTRGPFDERPQPLVDDSRLHPPRSPVPGTGIALLVHPRTSGPP